MSTFAAARGIKQKVARLNVTGFDVIRVVLVDRVFEYIEIITNFKKTPRNFLYGKSIR